MWISTKLGFFSVVKKGGPDEWQVRARVRADLDNLVSTAKRDSKIIDTPEADYACRIIVRQTDLVRLFSTLPASIDYSNFKDRIGREAGQRDKLHAYHDFWKSMLRLQRHL